MLGLCFGVVGCLFCAGVVDFRLGWLVDWLRGRLVDWFARMLFGLV